LLPNRALRVTNAVEESPPPEVIVAQLAKEFPQSVVNPEVCYCTQSSPTLDSTLSQLLPTHTLNLSLHFLLVFGSVSKMVSSFHTFQTTIFYVICLII
jgi:hypothetical protein